MAGALRKTMVYLGFAEEDDERGRAVVAGGHQVGGECLGTVQVEVTRLA